jgi:hypothetical protein
LPNLLEDAVHEIIYRHFRLGRESRSGSEIPALDSIDDKALWKPTKYPRQFDSRDKAESMARPAEGSSGQWSPARIPAVERAGLRAGQDRVKEDDGVGPFPAVHQVRSLAAVLQDPERPRPSVRQSPGGDQPRAVVTAISVAYSDHQDFSSHFASLRLKKQQILCCAQDDIWTCCHSECYMGLRPTNGDESPPTCHTEPAERERNLLFLFFTAKADSSSVAAATSSE